MTKIVEKCSTFIPTGRQRRSVKPKTEAISIDETSKNVTLKPVITYWHASRQRDEIRPLQVASPLKPCEFNAGLRFVERTPTSMFSICRELPYRPGIDPTCNSYLASARFSFAVAPC